MKKLKTEILLNGPEVSSVYFDFLSGLLFIIDASDEAFYSKI